jgi:hypothetical protein
MLTKDELIAIISEEIDDREATMRESGNEYDTTEEVTELNVILDCVTNEQSMTFTQYAWLCDLVETSVEIRSEQ